MLTTINNRPNMLPKLSPLFWGSFALAIPAILGQRFDLNSLRQAAVNQAQAGFACAEKDTHFELITGYVYTAPDDMLDSRPGTLMLTDCIELCKRNSTCKSANFETGLCVLFGSSAEEFPGKLCISGFPNEKAKEFVMACKDQIRSRNGITLIIGSE